MKYDYYCGNIKCNRSSLQIIPLDFYGSVVFFPEIDQLVKGSSIYALHHNFRKFVASGKELLSPKKLRELIRSTL